MRFSTFYLGSVIPSLFLVITLCDLPSLAADVVKIAGREFQVQSGFELSLIASPDLVPRPIVADFDAEGHLYVADSSGSNEDVQTQLRKKPHRVLKLRDTNGDGVFDARTVFADRLMFPEGVLWHDDSIYVSAPPQIWKLTDSDGDGVAEQREIWFDGETLTGCANDLHGPYMGRDGWMYWCKGAFAEQTHQLPSGQTWTSRASHIFRRRVTGGPIEPVMIGGMDNPVDVVFTPGGERIFSSTFLQHPSGGRRDGLIHAIYGGVYGKSHGVLDGHPRTGPLMPVLSHMGPAVPSGLTRLEGDQVGDEYEGNLIACAFNLHQVTRHVLRQQGASFQSDDSVLLASDHLDFHPTDVLQDADGSIVVIDTGGWYKLCCPSSQLHKPDVLGGIYRIRVKGAGSALDARGLRLDWDAPTEQLITRFDDPRPAVRSRAIRQLVKGGTVSIPALQSSLSANVSERIRNLAIWTACQIEDPASVSVLREGLTDPAASVRQASLHAISVRREVSTAQDVTQRLSDEDPAVRRAAAEAIGRLRHEAAIPVLLKNFEAGSDRALEHSFIFALIEIGSPRALQSEWARAGDEQRVALLIALDQMPGHSIDAKRVLASLSSGSAPLRNAALWVAQRHLEWGPELAEQLIRPIHGPDVATRYGDPTVRLLAGCAAQGEVQKRLAAGLSDPGATPEGIAFVIRVLRNYSGDELLPELQASVAQLLAETDDERLKHDVVSALSAHARTIDHAKLARELREMAVRCDMSGPLQLRAISALAGDSSPLPGELIQTALRAAIESDSFELRRSATSAVMRANLTRTQLRQVIDSLTDLGPVELGQLILTLKKTDDPRDAQRARDALSRSDAFVVVPDSLVREAFAHFDKAEQRVVDELLRQRSSDHVDKASRLQELLERLPDGDVRRGQIVFHSTKAACFACHEMGYRGGDIGPDLTRIGRIRSRRDLLEAIVYPSLSFVRSFEPVVVTTKDGLPISGVIKDENNARIMLVNDQRKNVEFARHEIEQIEPGRVSIMPSGLDQLLTDSELADLLAFLGASR